MKTLVKNILLKLKLYHLASFCKQYLHDKDGVLAQMRELKTFEAKIRPLIGKSATKGPKCYALIIALDGVAGAALHVVLVGSLRLAGYEPIIAISARSFILERAYRALGVKRFVFIFDRESIYGI